MAEVKVSEEIDLPVEEVWALVSDFDISKWAEVGSCRVEGEGVGAVRTIGLPGGATISERLEALDPQSHTFSYSIIPGGPLPVEGYLATVELHDLGDGRTRLDWTGRFAPLGISEAHAVGMIQGIYQNGIQGIKKALGL